MPDITSTTGMSKSRALNATKRIKLTTRNIGRKEKPPDSNGTAHDCNNNRRESVWETT
jgi:hypothetical protein